MTEEPRPERRRAARIVPREPVTAAVEGASGPVASGMVADVSEDGACVRTDGEFGVGDAVLVRLGFDREPQPVPATGRVVWKRPNGAGLRYGLQWNHVGPQRARLGLLLETLA